MMSFQLTSVVNAIFLACLLTFSHGLLRWLSTQEAGSFVNCALQNWRVTGTAIAIYIFIFFYYAYILKFISISVLYPVYTGLSIIFVFLMGTFFFHEPYSMRHIIGCVLIIAGIYLVSGASNDVVVRSW